MSNTNADVADILSGKKTNGAKGGWLKPTIITLAILGALAGAWFWWSSINAPKPPLYITEAVTTGDITVTVIATGSVEPTNQVEISSELSGTIVTVEKDFNDTVKKDEALAWLDTVSLEANLAHARATLSGSEARLIDAQITLEETEASYDRALQLDERGITSSQALLAARASYRRAQAAFSIAQANVEIARADVGSRETDLEKACICSPIDGVVLDRSVDVGQIVAASFSAPILYTLAEDLTRMQVQVDIDEADIGTVNEGDVAMFTVESHRDLEFPAVISEVRFAPLTVNGVVTYKAILATENNDLLLRPGMTATAEITVETRKTVPRIPNAALRFSPPAGVVGDDIAPEEEGRRVWVLRDEQAVPMTITTGASDDTHTEVTGGPLGVGDLIITDSEPQ